MESENGCCAVSAAKANEARKECEKKEEQKEDLKQPEETEE